MIFPLIAFVGLGGGELIVIMLALLLLFGPKDAPRILRSIQNVLNKLQRAAADFRYKLMYEDLHRSPTEESKDTEALTVEEKSAEDKHAEESEEIPPQHLSDDGSKP